MRQRHVVIVAFPGLQPLDAVGPIEVFAGATRAAAALGRPRRLPRHPRLHGRRHRSGPRAGWCWARCRCPTRASASTRSSSPGATAPGGAPTTRRCCRGSRRRRPRCRRVATVCTGAFLAPRPDCSTAAGSPPTGPGPSSWPREYPDAHGRRRSDLHPRRQVLDERRRHRRHRPGPGAGRRTTSASTWPRRWPAGW